MILEPKLWMLKEMVDSNLTDNHQIMKIVQEKRYYSYQNEDDKKIKLDAVDLSLSDLKHLQSISDRKDENTKETYHYKWLSNKIKDYLKMLEDISGEQKIKSVDKMTPALIAYLSQLPHKLLFCKMLDDKILPWYIYQIYFRKGEKRNKDSDGSPDTCVISLSALVRNEKKSKTITFYPSDKGKTAKQLTREKGLLLENPELLKIYLQTIERYEEIMPQLGRQFSAIGVNQSNSTSMIRDGEPTKFIIDDNGEDSDKNAPVMETRRVTDATFWKKQPEFYREVELLEVDENDPDYVPQIQALLPVHPYIKGFDIKKHEWQTVHSDYLEEYQWDKNLVNKLVLPDKDKNLIKILVDSTNNNVEDIVKGKMSGVIVLATGVPGVGKTLTAEVVSEGIEKALYSVQCSQLGLNVDTVEKNLQLCLRRATRWGAILLFDEADVYITQRGQDMHQNAIVGVFLRLLEYYRGVLFMTSNLGEIIDDAIMSRATAWIKYELPTVDNREKIWSVLSKQYQAEFSDKDLKNLAEKYEISGRTIRNLLKLASILNNSNNEKITVKTIEFVSQYQMLN